MAKYIVMFAIVGYPIIAILAFVIQNMWEAPKKWAKRKQESILHKYVVYSYYTGKAVPDFAEPRWMSEVAARTLNFCMAQQGINQLRWVKESEV